MSEMEDSTAIPIAEIRAKAKKKFRTLTIFAGRLDRTSAAVSQWYRVPAELVLKVEELVGIPRWRQRPDIYPAPRARKSA